MDNSDLRRGRATCHKQFDEATAVLAGDGLLTAAFGVLADPDTHGDPAVRCELVTELATAAGAAAWSGVDDRPDCRDQGLDIGAITGFADEDRRADRLLVTEADRPQGAW